MQNQLNPLQEEILNDPNNLGYANKTPLEVTALLNIQDKVLEFEPETGKVVNLMAQNGMTIAVYRAKDSVNYAGFPQPLKDVINMTLKISASDFPTMNFKNPLTLAMIGGLVQAGIWTEAQVEAVKALGRKNVSQAFKLLGRDVTVSEVSRVVWADKWMLNDAKFGEARIEQNKLNEGVDPNQANEN